MLTFYSFLLYDFAIFFSVVLFFRTLHHPKQGYLFILISVFLFYPSFIINSILRDFPNIFLFFQALTPFLVLIAGILSFLISKKIPRWVNDKFYRYPKFVMIVFLLITLIVSPITGLLFVNYTLIAIWLLAFSILPLLITYLTSKNKLNKMIGLSVINLVLFFCSGKMGTNEILFYLTSLFLYFIAFIFLIYNQHKFKDISKQIWIARGILFLNFLLILIYNSVIYFLAIYAANHPQL